MGVEGGGSDGDAFKLGWRPLESVFCGGVKGGISVPTECKVEGGRGGGFETMVERAVVVLEGFPPRISRMGAWGERSAGNSGGVFRSNFQL